MVSSIPPILQVGDVLLSSDILTEEFCCDLDVCHGACCIEGDAGAPVTLDEVMEIEAALDAVCDDLSTEAKAVIDRQGVAYTDEEGDLVTSIVGGKDCVFTCYAPDTSDISSNGKGAREPSPAYKLMKGLCLCALERACRAGKTTFIKPISCALYPIREKQFRDGTVGLNYHRWDICRCGRDKGRQLHLPLYRFLREPLVRRFGQQWYDDLCTLAHELLLAKNQQRDSD